MDMIKEILRIMSWGAIVYMGWLLFNSYLENRKLLTLKNIIKKIRGRK